MQLYQPKYSSSRGRHARFCCSFPLLVIVMLLLSTGVHASYSYITVTSPSSIAGDYGCMPTLFGSTNAKSGHLSAALTIPQRASLNDDFDNDGEDGCPVNLNGKDVSPLDGKVPAGSSVLLSLKLVDCNIRCKFKCSSKKQVENAISAGASGVIFTNVFSKTLPRTLGYSFIQDTVDIPVCAVTKEIGNLFRETTEQITIDWSNYVGWTSELEPLPPHRETPIEILSPWELKWTYPAAMASFNPDEVDPINAELVMPKWHTSCQYFYSVADCQACYDLKSPFETPDDILKGKIFLFVDYPACFENYQHYPYLTQKHGGVAAIMRNPTGDTLPLSVGPYTLGFKLSVAVYIMKSSQVEYIHYILRGGNKGIGGTVPSVHLSLPKITNGWGPNFTPHEDDLESIPDTTLSFTPKASGNQANSCNGGSYPAGQTTYNPSSMVESRVDLTLGVVDGSCKLQATKENEGAGVDCATCLSKIDAGTVFINDESINGKVILIKADDIFCAHEFIDITKVVQDKGGKGLIISMKEDVTMTLVAGSGISQSLRDSISIPTYNMRKSHGTEMLQKLSTCNGAGGSIDAVLPKLSDGKAPERTPHATTNVGTTQVIINTGSEQSIVDAGQALFNPRNSKKISSRMRKIYLASVCNAKTSCQHCYLLDSPIRNRAGLQGAIAVLELDGASCIRPVYNYVLYAQKLQAAGVLFVTSGNYTLTLGPVASDKEAITIPSFSLPRKVFNDIGGDTLYYKGTITFPPLDNFVAPDSTVQSSSEMIVNKEGDVPDTDETPSIDNGKVVNESINVPLLIGFTVAGIVICIFGGKRLCLIRRRNKMIAFGGMTHETTTQTNDFTNIFEQDDNDKNMFDNMTIGDHIKSGAKVIRPSMRMSRVKLKSMSQPPPPAVLPQQAKISNGKSGNKGNDSMKSFDIESGEVDTENSNRSSTNMSVGVPLQQSLRRHTIASASRLRVTLEEEERNGIGKGKGK